MTASCSSCGPDGCAAASTSGVSTCCWRRRCDITDEEIARVQAGPDAAGWDPFEATLLRAADELHADAKISDATWAALAERYDTEQLLDTVFTVGQYHTVAFALNSCGVQLDAGVPGFDAAT